MQIAVKAYPQLRALCWNRPDNAIVEGEEALALYETNWRHVDAENMEQEERLLLETLVARFGNGTFMPSC